MTPWNPSLIMRILQLLCPHALGWSAVPNGRYRFCRCCAARQRLVGGIWIFPAHVRERGIKAVFA